MYDGMKKWKICSLTAFVSAHGEGMDGGWIQGTTALCDNCLLSDTIIYLKIKPYFLFWDIQSSPTRLASKMSKTSTEKSTSYYRLTHEPDM